MDKLLDSLLAGLPMASSDPNSNPYQSPTTDASVAPVQTAESSRFAPCPNCQQRNAKKVSWTLWGGALGPWMFNHVKCNACRSTFNGKTGRSNTTAIVIYLVVSLVLGVVIFGALSLAMQF